MLPVSQRSVLVREQTEATHSASLARLWGFQSGTTGCQVREDKVASSSNTSRVWNFEVRLLRASACCRIISSRFTTTLLQEMKSWQSHSQQDNSSNNCVQEELDDLTFVIGFCRNGTFITIKARVKRKVLFGLHPSILHLSFYLQCHLSVSGWSLCVALVRVMSLEWWMST